MFGRAEWSRNDRRNAWALSRRLLVRQPQTEDRVELTSDLPEMSLHMGDQGVVCSAWFTPIPVYEFCFESRGVAFHVRALIVSNDFRVVHRSTGSEA
jgi:hypothetical protein